MSNSHNIITKEDKTSTDVFVMSESKLYFMTRQEKVAEMVEFLGKYPDGILNSTSHAIGGGEWSLEVRGSGFDSDGEEESYLLFELIGSNGTRDGENPSDLHQQLRDIIAEAKELFPF